MLDDAFIGEIRIFASNAIPLGWMPCAGQELIVQQNQALFSLLGNSYGGDGIKFNLPDLRGRAPMGDSDKALVGGKGGVEKMRLTQEQMPVHNHAVMCDETADINKNTNGPSVQSVPSIAIRNNAAGQPQTLKLYMSNAALENNQPMVALEAGAITVSGGGMAHENRQPFLVLNYCIAIAGIYPPRR